MIRRVLIYLILTIAPCVARAQITLADYIESVSAYSHELEDKNLAMQGAREKELAAKRDYLPMFDLAREMNIDMRNPAIGRR